MHGPTNPKFATHLVSVCVLLTAHYFFCSWSLTVVGVLCIELLSCVYLCFLMHTVLLCAYCCLTYFSRLIAG